MMYGLVASPAQVREYAADTGLPWHSNKAHKKSLSAASSRIVSRASSIFHGHGTSRNNSTASEHKAKTTSVVNPVPRT